MSLPRSLIDPAMLPRTVDSFSDRLRQYVAVPPDVTSATASSLAVDIRTFPWIRRLASDYAFAYEQVAPFFAGNPALPAAWADTITPVAVVRATAAEVARVLAAQQERRGAPRAAREAAAKLADAATRVVITGQQAGRVRRTAVHVAEGADGDEARRAGLARPSAWRSCRCSGLTRKTTTGPK